MFVGASTLGVDCCVCVAEGRGGGGLWCMFVWELEVCGVHLCSGWGSLVLVGVSVRAWVYLGVYGWAGCVCLHASGLVGVSSVCLRECVWPCHRRLQAWPHKLHTPAGGLRQPRSGCDRQWEADGAGWRPYGAGGGGAFLPPRAARKPPACRPPMRAGAGTDTVTNALQPVWSQEGGCVGSPCPQEACGREGVQEMPAAWGCCLEQP